MAYFDTTSPAGVLSREITATRDLFNAIRRNLAGVLRAMGQNAAMNARLAKVQRLQALSDADLARIGLRREDIVRRVFADILHI